MGVSRLAILSVFLLACGDGDSREHRGGPPPDASVDAAIDARPYACLSEADCGAGEGCILCISPGGAVGEPFCGPLPSTFCRAILCDPLASSCTRFDSTAGTCHADVELGLYDHRRWNVCSQ